MRITVAIPTYNRPGFLHSCLNSVANQSKPNLIEEVLVSENSSNHRSEEVCERFPNLPIKYTTRSPSLSAHEHICRVISESTSEFVAPLADDDIWSRHHLDNAHQALSSDESLSGFCDQAVKVHDETRHVFRPFEELTFHDRHLTSQDQSSDFWIWTPTDLLLESLLVTPLNLWALVAKKRFLEQAVSSTPLPPGMDSDRLFFWNLILHGDLAVGREIGLFYRIHAESNCKKLSKEDRTFHFLRSKAYTEKIIRDAGDLGIDVIDTWSNCWNELPPEKKRRLFAYHLEGSAQALCEHLGYDIFSTAIQSRNPIIENLKLITPPFAWNLAKQIIQRKPNQSA